MAPATALTVAGALANPKQTEVHMSENTAGKPAQPSNRLAMTWLRPDPSIRHTPGTEYATDGDFVYERFKDALGQYVYRRARWSAIAVDIEWLDLDGSIWEAIAESDLPRGNP